MWRRPGPVTRVCAANDVSASNHACGARAEAGAADEHAQPQTCWGEPARAPPTHPVAGSGPPLPPAAPASGPLISLSKPCPS